MIETGWHSSVGGLARLYATLLDTPMYHTTESDLGLLSLTARIERPELWLVEE